MAYKKKTDDIGNNQEMNSAPSASAEFTSNEPKSVVIHTTKKVPMDALVYVKNLTGGTLVYTSKALNGYTLIWEKFGDELPIEMRELYNMKNIAPKFFRENWVQVDISVLRDLNVEHYYKDFISYEDIENMSNGDIDKVIKKLEKASPAIRNSIGLRAMEMINAGEMTDINIIRKLENALHCNLIENDI